MKTITFILLIQTFTVTFAQFNNNFIPGEKLEYHYDLYDEYDLETDTISMARTTGYTCTAVANLLLKGKFDRKGVSPPEYVGQKNRNFEHVVEYLRERGVFYQANKVNY